MEGTGITCSAMVPEAQKSHAQEETPALLLISDAGPGNPGVPALAVMTRLLAQLCRTWEPWFPYPSALVVCRTVAGGPEGQDFFVLVTKPKEFDGTGPAGWAPLQFPGTASGSTGAFVALFGDLGLEALSRVGYLELQGKFDVL